MGIATTIFIIAVLLFAAIVASKLSSRLGVPSLVLFVGVGMLAGSDGLLGIEFEDHDWAQFIGVFALNFILFSGGMDTKTKDVFPVFRTGMMLSVFGTLLTALLVGAFVYLATDENVTLLEAMLLGSIVSSTDAAAIFSIFRSKGVTLRHRLRPVLELESGSNDPMAYFLTVTIIFLINNPSDSIASMVPLFIKGMVLGAIAGIVMGRIIVLVINRVRLNIDGLYPVLVIAMTLFTYSISELMQGNGILSIYIAGIIVGNRDFVRKATITKFYEGFTWLMQIVVFVMLGLLVFPSQIPDIVIPGIAVALFLIFIARPIAVFITTFGTKLTIKDRVLLGWGGLRGASPIIFATYPMVAGIESAWVIFHLVFFVSLTSVLLQGSTLTWVADKLSLLSKKRAEVITVPLELSSGSCTMAQEIELHHDSHILGKKVSQISISKNIVFLLIERGNTSFIPQADSQVLGGDILVVLSDDAIVLSRFKDYVNIVKDVKKDN